MTDFYATGSSYQAWAALRRADPKLADDSARAANSYRPRFSSQVRDDESLPGKGRPVIRTPNPVASIMPLMSLNRPQWLDDIVYGAVATAAGASKGKLNVKPSAVLAALHLSAISTRAVWVSEMSQRTAQSIAKATRHAAHGIAAFLDRHPAIKTGLTRLE